MKIRNFRKMYFNRKRKLFELEQTRNLNQAPKKGMADEQAVISSCGYDPINRRIFWHFCH
jgi:hypothetical protein